MLEVNDAYVSAFRIERKYYLGKTDLEAGWSREVSENFRKHDLTVWASGEPETFTEKIDGKDMRFRKIRIQSNDGTLKGIMGYAVECVEPQTCPYWSACASSEPSHSCGMPNIPLLD
jgi:hypothetical protein